MTNDLDRALIALRVSRDHGHGAVLNDAEVPALLAEIDRLTRELAEARAELERERMRLAACGVVAMSNTSESAAKDREMHEDYRSASCDDVAAAVDREMALRAEVADLKRAVQHEADCVEAARAEVEALRAAAHAARKVFAMCRVEITDSDIYDKMIDAWKMLDAAVFAQIEQEERP